MAGLPAEMRDINGGHGIVSKNSHLFAFWRLAQGGLQTDDGNRATISAQVHLLAGVGGLVAHDALQIRKTAPFWRGRFRIVRYLASFLKLYIKSEIDQRAPWVMDPAVKAAIREYLRRGCAEKVPGADGDRRQLIATHIFVDSQ